MDFNDWQSSEVDRGRLGRLGVGGIVGTALIVAVVTAFTLNAAGESEAPDDGLDVELVEQVVEQAEPEPEPEPQPEPEPAAAPQPQIAAPAPPAPAALPELAVPDAIPDGPVKETDPSASTAGAADPYGDPNVRTAPGAVGTGAHRATPPPAMPPPLPPKPKPRRKKPTRLTEDMTPPRQLSGGAPAYPAALKSSGVEGVVIVRFVVTTSGATSNVRAVRGPSALRAVCVAAVRGWRFKPALDAQGSPVAVPRTRRFRFKH